MDVREDVEVRREGAKEMWVGVEEVGSVRALIGGGMLTSRKGVNFVLAVRHGSESALIVAIKGKDSLTSIDNRYCRIVLIPFGTPL